MEDYKAFEALARIRQTVHDAGLCVANEIPCGSVLKRNLNHLEELAYIVRAYYDATKDEAFAREVASVPRHVFPQIIAWKKLQSKTQKSVARCFKILYEIAAHANEPQQTHDEPEAKSMELDDKLAFVPETHREAAKATFERLLRDGWIKSTPTGFEWLVKPKGRLWYFAAMANEEWGVLYDSGKYSWQGFASLFGVKASFFIDWQRKTGYGRLGRNKARNLPKDSREIESYF